MATKYSVPDYIDQLILLLIEAGGGQCWYLASVFGYSKSAITQRVSRMITYGLVEPVKKMKGKNERSYILTSKGKEVVTFDRVQFQIKILEIKKGLKDN